MTPKPEGFPKDARILKRNEYRAIQRSSLRVVTDHFIIYARRRRSTRHRIGITVSKKVGNAVVRNRVKRAVRESFRLNQSALPQDLDLVLVARRGRPVESFAQTVEQLVSGANQLAELYIKKKNRKAR